MKKVVTAITGVLLLATAEPSQADNVSKVMCEQFSIEGATRIVTPTEQFSADFAPPHHAPRNIPLEVAIPGDAEAYIHFPIVQDGTYIIYTTDPDRIAGLKEKSGDTLATTSVNAPQDCSDVLKGGLKADIELGALKGPTPIAIELRQGSAQTIRLIVSRDPIN